MRVGGRPKTWMMLFSAKLDPRDVRDFYFGEDRLAALYRSAPADFDVEIRARLWPTPS